MFYCELRGIHFRQPEEKEYASALSVGSRLSLVREPTNEYDMYAIKVMAKGDGYSYHLGYVAKEVAMWVAPEMDASEEEIFTAIVVDFDRRKNTIYPILNIGTFEEVDAWIAEQEDPDEFEEA